MSLRPLDLYTVNASVRKTRGLITVEQGLDFLGVGVEIWFIYLFTLSCISLANSWKLSKFVLFLYSNLVVEESGQYLDAKPQMISGPDLPIRYVKKFGRKTGSVVILLKYYLYPFFF
jgi:hypothetical protein